MLHLIALDAHTLGRTPLVKGSASRLGLYFFFNQKSEYKVFSVRWCAIHALGGKLTNHLRKRTAADPLLRRRGHRDRPLGSCVK